MNNTFFICQTLVCPEDCSLFIEYLILDVLKYVTILYYSFNYRLADRFQESLLASRLDDIVTLWEL